MFEKFTEGAIKVMKFFSKDKCAIAFLLVFFIARPISYEELRERQWKRDHRQFSEINLVVRNPEPRSRTNKLLNEYDYLMGLGRGNDLILAAFRGKFLVNYDLTIDSNNNNRLNVDLRIVQKDSKNPENEIDVIASIPEDRVLAKLY